MVMVSDLEIQYPPKVFWEREKWVGVGAGEGWWCMPVTFQYLGD